MSEEAGMQSPSVGPSGQSLPGVLDSARNQGRQHRGTPSQSMQIGREPSGEPLSPFQPGDFTLGSDLGNASSRLRSMGNQGLPSASGGRRRASRSSQEHPSGSQQPLSPFQPGSILRSDLGTASSLLRSVRSGGGGRRLSTGSGGRRGSLPGVLESGEGGVSQQAPLSPINEDLNEGEDQLIWGTRISVASMQRRIRGFLKDYVEAGHEDRGRKYRRYLEQMAEDQSHILNVDCADVRAHDEAMYRDLVSYPTEVIVLMDFEALALLNEILNVETSTRIVYCKPFNLAETKVIRDLDPADINTLVAVTGMVTRCSNIIPELRMALFKCAKCGAEACSFNDGGLIAEPSQCTACSAKFTMALQHNRSTFYNKQVLKMQESPNAIPEGETPHSVTALCFDDAVDAARPGDRVTIVGTYKALPMKANPRTSALRSVFKTHIDVVHVERTAAGALTRPVEPLGAEADVAPPLAAPMDEDADALLPDTTQQEAQAAPMDRNQTVAEAAALEAEMRELAADPAVYERLAASLAPGIWQLDDVKKGLLCQLFGGTNREFSGGRTRGELNILLVGDPGVAKSQLLSYVNKIAPRGLYTSGRGSSAVGLTAYVARDAESREAVLESGALVLSDRGICCIDEFDKMSESARSMLHEVMEQQTVSVAKAGIIATLNARTSVLAAANPVGSRYNPHQSIVDNINLPPSLLSRFDLIYLLLDKPEEATDRNLARHLLSAFYPAGHAAAAAGGDEAPPIPLAALKEFIAYARAKCHPVLSPEAGDDLVAGYLGLRRMGASRKVITATPRQLESLIRMSEALARMRLSPTVTRADAAEALRLLKVAAQQSATDPLTGAIDMDKILTGLSASDRTARAHLAEELKALLLGKPGGMQISELATAINAQAAGAGHVTPAAVRAALQSVPEEVQLAGNLARHQLAAGAAA